MKEDDYVNKIVKFLINNKFDIWKEVIPDECKNWEHPFRVDLIFYKFGIGYIAVECKLCNTLRAGAKIARGVEQIKKYARLTYFDGTKINRWCLLVKPHEYENDEFLRHENRGIIFFLKNFLNFYDISIMEFIEYNNHNYDRIAIDTYSKNSLHIKNNEFMLKHYDS